MPVIRRLGVVAPFEFAGATETKSDEVSPTYRFCSEAAGADGGTAQADTGPMLGIAVGTAVGAMVGMAVGTAVGGEVGIDVGTAVGIAVGVAVPGGVDVAFGLAVAGVVTGTGPPEIGEDGEPEFEHEATSMAATSEQTRRKDRCDTNNSAGRGSLPR